MVHNRTFSNIKLFLLWRTQLDLYIVCFLYIVKDRFTVKLRQFKLQDCTFSQTPTSLNLYAYSCSQTVPFVFYSRIIRLDKCQVRQDYLIRLFQKFLGCLNAFLLLDIFSNQPAQFIVKDPMGFWLGLHSIYGLIWGPLTSIQSPMVSNRDQIYPFALNN